MTKKLLMERKIDWFEQPKSVQLGAFVKFVKEEGGEKEAEPYVETGDENHPFDAKAAEIKRMFISNRTVHFDETGRQFLFDPVWDCNNE